MVLTSTDESNEIICCEDRLVTWWRKFADGPYTYGSQVAARSRPNVITNQMIETINSPAMRARTNYKSWEPFLGKVIPELEAIPTNVDLVQAGEKEYTEARNTVMDLYIALTKVNGITDMSVSKACWPHRPKLLAISDSYVRNSLGVPDRRKFGSTRERYAKSGVAIMDGIRDVGLRNPQAMARLDFCLKGLIGKDIPASDFLSMARIIDIFLWTEADIKQNPNAFWSGWNQKHVSICQKSIRLKLR